MIKFGWNLRVKSRDYGLVLQGGGIGILILTTFVSLKMYSLISAPVAFLLLVCFAASTAWLAVHQDSMNLAAFGLLGGFIAPILASTGQGQHVVLFSYYTVLNLAIVYISFKKAWRELNLLGFIFTFAISSLWGGLKYQPEFYASTQPFLILFFLIYVAIPLLFAKNKEPELKGYVDGTIVFGNSIITIFLQLQLVHDIEYAGAYSALALAAFYIFLSRYLIKHKNSNYKMLAEAFISIGTIFTTIAIPLAFDGIKTSAIWALEAAGIYWISLSQNRQLARYFSTLLILITSISFFLGPARGVSEFAFLNSFYFSCFMMAAGFYVIGYLSDKYKAKLSESELWVSNLSIFLGTAWWILGGLFEIDRLLRVGNVTILTNVELTLETIYLTVGAVAVFLIGQKWKSDKFRYLAHGYVFILFFLYWELLESTRHPFGGFESLSWIFAFGAYYWILFYNDKNFENKNSFFLKLGHIGSLLILVGVLVRESKWLAEHYVPESTAWQFAAQLVVPTFSIWFITAKKETLRWPVQRNYETYFELAVAPIVGISWLWLMITNWRSGGSALPLPYLPILNPLELSHIGALMAMTFWCLKIFSSSKFGYSVTPKQLGIGLGGTYFLWLNGVLCRTVHQYFSVPFDFDSLFSSVIVQVSFSLFWTLLGIAIMIFASKKQYRWLWITGASLLGIVVAKMFMIDLSKTETIARVISFIGVGVLFLVVGYFSPIPPKTTPLEVRDHAS